MSTTYRWPIEKHLKSYLALVDYWEDGAGDTHELLGVREILHDRSAELLPSDIKKMQSADDRVLALRAANSDKSGWDVQMLKETAVLIERERPSYRLAA